MKTFYLFKLNRNYHKVAKTKPFNIYCLLNSIYTYRSRNIKIPYNLFKEICLPINKDFFNDYYYNSFSVLEEYTKFKNIHMYNNYLTGEVSKLVVNNSHLKIKSNIDENIFILNITDNMFICNFKDSQYKYLKNKTVDNRKK